ncbi:YraN family protein [Cohnella cholangitidis]|uniref:UPF0102 protein FPL14_02470 n=1 Tax=Cohnella cholangitidis TaxID=2598458 RepID=A0A7G5BTA6_9BACL|nr:YraN family protein [Cohnella cholangitidis]QMV40190.1 YraN family protein [Cohnella cholangitidis]
MGQSPSPSSTAKDRRVAVGKAGEDAAAHHLQQSGYLVEGRNWRCRSGELDLIARDGETLVFVEVRSRSNPSRFGTAVEAVTPRKCRQVRELATIYLKQRKDDAILSVRFDVVAVTFGKDGGLVEVKHLQGAF